jgi:hypothetical protein
MGSRTHHTGCRLFSQLGRDIGEQVIQVYPVKSPDRFPPVVIKEVQLKLENRVFSVLDHVCMPFV